MGNMRKSKEGTQRAVGAAVTAIAAILGIYHFIYARYMLTSAYRHIMIHYLGCFAILFFGRIRVDADREAARGQLLKNVVCLALAAIMLADTIYIYAHHDQYLQAMGNYSAGQIVSGAVYLAVFLIATYMAWGKVIPMIVVLFLLYGYFGSRLPGFLYHGGLSVKRLITYSTTNFTGVFGMMGQITANTIILFSVFGGMLDSFGALECIMNVAMSASGKVRSGGAQVAVIASGLIGSVTGQVAANISMTGTVSIPLMKKRGYPPEFAAAAEATASTGGAILPPVMNAAAFIIASWTNTPYIKIVILGATPAVLYFLGIALSVYIKAIKLGDERVDDDSLPQFRSAATEFFVFIIPIIVLVILMAQNLSSQMSLFYAIIAMMLVGFCKQFRKGRPVKDSLQLFARKLVGGFAGGAKSCAAISIVLAATGVVVQILTATGLPSKISQFVVASAGSSLFLLGVMVAISCVVFGMGMPAAPAYVLCALLGAPALTSFGVPLLAAHFFVFYFGEMSALTPPVAIGCLVASGMAKADFMKTCITSLRLAIAGFVLPFMFLYRPSILFGLGTVGGWAWAVMMIVIFLFTFIIACEGFFLDKLTVPERLAAIAAAACCVMPVYVLDFVGIILAVAIILMHAIRLKRQK
ncbi:TRAP transporter fused permease subunit [Clostridiaceae bacterium]|nr:TRAP transporter fused permease subunit [Clostridiaceae bacterium]RKI15262.1 TRAP transporter fused permease subunit [bacterium 1XD21-70]